MVNLLAWVRSRLQTSVDEVWCVRCQARQTVRRVEIVKARHGKRMVGECMVCGGQTSTFVSA